MIKENIPIFQKGQQDFCFALVSRVCFIGPIKHYHSPLAFMIKLPIYR